MTSAIRLTVAQRRELRDLARRAQSTFGKHRSRVQNCLVAKGLARFCDEQGQAVSRYKWVSPGIVMQNLDAVSCEITEAGRVALREEGGDAG